MGRSAHGASDFGTPMKTKETAASGVALNGDTAEYSAASSRPYTTGIAPRIRALPLDLACHGVYDSIPMQSPPPVRRASRVPCAVMLTIATALLVVFASHVAARPSPWFDEEMKTDGY